MVETTAMPVTRRTSPTTILAIRMDSSGLIAFGIGLCAWRHGELTVALAWALAMAVIRQQNERASNSDWLSIDFREKEN